MNNQIRLKIGDFSQLMHVTIRTLRHYEQIGLLKPYEVDEWTGYRYYKVAGSGPRSACVTVLAG